MCIIPLNIILEICSFLSLKIKIISLPPHKFMQIKSSITRGMYPIIFNLHFTFLLNILCMRARFQIFKIERMVNSKLIEVLRTKSVTTVPLSDTIVPGLIKQNKRYGYCLSLVGIAINKRCLVFLNIPLNIQYRSTCLLLLYFSLTMKPYFIYLYNLINPLIAFRYSSRILADLSAVQSTIVFLFIFSSFLQHFQLSDARPVLN